LRLFQHLVGGMQEFSHLHCTLIKAILSRSLEMLEGFITSLFPYLQDISFDVSTTLIVVPESLLHQWYEEIRRHCTEDVRIDVYYGVAYDGYKHPLYLESYDIVLCAYETLQREIHHVITTSPSSYGIYVFYFHLV
uniref:SNF2_N domain-containing protein n=1 Tax=Angiostrongylus cantonensis TaxID=6313 RepID=A0A0K0CV16_ANGCA